MMDEQKEKSEELLLAEAMLKAKEAFFKYFDDEGEDSAYWSIEMHGFMLSSDFKKWREIVMKDVEQKVEK